MKVTDRQTCPYLQAIQRERLNRPGMPCEESQDYSYSDCINQGMARLIGCQSFWSDFPDIPRCRDFKSMNTYMKNYTGMILDFKPGFDSLGCLEPCNYIKYEVTTNTIMIIIIKLIN